MKIFLLLSIVAVAYANHECGENSHFESCGTSCPLTCDNYDSPPFICNLRCNIGCQCDKGYVRDSEGRCVKPEACPAKAQQVCGENQRYLECGTACPLTCDNVHNPPKICPAMCVMGCHCKEGFVKTREGRCIRKENCPLDARPNEKNCFDKPDPGMCLAYMPSWYYDVQSGKCHQFIYGGCQGNGNNYATEEECMEHCASVSTMSFSSACDYPAEPGVCRGYFPRFYFDRTTSQCLRFIYGGCGGNENNFETVEECQQTCAQSAPSACQQEKVVGPCKAAFRRFFFNKDTGKCEMFIYGGCNGNSNNFHSQEDCEEVCAVHSAPTACEQEQIVGPCRGAFKRWSFNKDTGKCEMFIYGGCNGNSNNFHSQEDCEAVCAA